jgi:uncharacterized membrane protein
MSDPTPTVTAGTPHVDESLVTYTHVIYGLHALAVLIGISTAHTIVGSFVGSFPSIIAVIMNYARRSATVGTFLESHFRWQIRTFWFALLWTVVCTVLIFTIIGAIIGLPGFLALGVWIIYRVARGWLALKDRRPMYV